MFITKRVMFSAAHRLFNPTFDAEKNELIFDKCNNFYGHGHNYYFEVTIKGVPDPETGYVIDLKKLKKIIMAEIVDKVDHKHLNFDVDFLKGIIPTVENLCIVFWEILNKALPDGSLYKIKLYETDDSFCEYYGEPIETKKYD